MTDVRFTSARFDITLPEELAEALSQGVIDYEFIDGELWHLWITPKEAADVA